jgi:N-acetylmuramoyl-L-alanine amidase
VARRPASPGRTTSSARIALSLGAVVTVVVLVVWGLASLAGAMNRGLEPAAPAGAKVATAAAPAAIATQAAAEPTPPPPKPKPKPKPKAVVKATPKTKWVVVIDPGHERGGQGDSSQEPIGPGSSKTKDKVASGASGPNGVPESLVNLQVSLKLRDMLAAKGVKVVMVRTTENVNISNSERAKIGNAAHANLVVRVHCDGVDGSIHGFMTVIPDDNQWTHSWLAASRKAGDDIQAAALRATGAADRGVQPPPVQMTGFNWSTVPSVIVEMGNMGNNAEDRNLSDPAYQGKLATGITNGVMAYLNGR